MKLKTKPHEIDAFQFKHKDTKPPKWFLEANRVGEVSVTIKPDNMYITIYQRDGVQKASVTDWVCINSSGTIFALTDTEVSEQFEPVEDA